MEKLLTCTVNFWLFGLVLTEYLGYPDCLIFHCLVLDYANKCILYRIIRTKPILSFQIRLTRSLVYFIWQITSFSVAPPILLQLTKNEELLKKYDLSSLMVIGSGSAPLPKSVNADAMVKTKSLVMQGNSYCKIFVLVLNSIFWYNISVLPLLFPKEGEIKFWSFIHFVDRIVNWPI